MNLVSFFLTSLIYLCGVICCALYYNTVCLYSYLKYSLSYSLKKKLQVFFHTTTKYLQSFNGMALSSSVDPWFSRDSNFITGFQITKRKVWMNFGDFGPNGFLIRGQNKAKKRSIHN